MNMLPLTTLIQENSLEMQQKKLIIALKKHSKKRQMSEEACNQIITWALRFLRFHNNQHPINLNQRDVETYLSSLATEKYYAHNTQKKAANALAFLYQSFLKIKLSQLHYIKIKSKRGFLERYGHSKCRSVLSHMQGSSLIMAELVLAGRLKLSEVVNLKLSDVDLKKNKMTVNHSNKNASFSFNIPYRLILDIRIQLMRVRRLVQVKNQQFRHQPSQSSMGTQNEYLFPIANIENPHISSKSMQLSLFKNEIKMAFERHLKSSGSTIKIPPHINKKIAKNSQIKNGVYYPQQRRQSQHFNLSTLNKAKHLQLGVA